MPLIELVEVAFWVASLLVVYPYLIYPPLLRLLAHLFPARATSAVIEEELPMVSFVISAYNEEPVIGAKLDNALELDYPAERFEIIVVSDASTDATDAIVGEYAARNPRVRLIRQSERRGKSAGLNRAVEKARGDVLVFSDANAMYQRQALRRLVRHFSDPAIGYVVGAALYGDSHESEVKQSEGLYWRLELWLKHQESRLHTVVGGDGAIYAIRHELFWDLRDDDISDFVNPMQIVAAGYRGVFDPEARCFEDSADEFAKEFRRKRRIVNRSWRAFRRYGGRLRLRRHARFLFALYSHKVVRWLALGFVAVALAANLALVTWTGVALYQLTLAAILASFALAAAGAWRDARGASIPRVLYIPYYFYLVNLAGILGIWDEYRGVRHATWEHVRESANH